MPLTFKKVMGNYPSGVAIVTTKNNQQEPVGILINSFVSISINPNLVMWSIGHGSRMYDVFESTDQFTINLLAGHQTHLLKDFTRPFDERFVGIDWSYDETSNPIVNGTYASLECTKVSTFDAGNHTMYIAEVKTIHFDEDLPPLLYHKRHSGPIPESFYNNDNK